jgi:exopolysaccharide biosynthesis polyprenyl glycosylphosphotransferase
MNKKLHTLKYITLDYFAALLAWISFFIYRKIYIESIKYGTNIPVEFTKEFILGLIFIPLFWLTLYYLNGYYKDIYRKSRLKELWNTFFISLVGTLIIFFALILDDTIVSYKDYYSSFSILFTLHFTFTYLPRVTLTTYTNHRIQNRKIGFNTLMVGSNKKALKLFNELKSSKKSAGYKFLGFVSVYDKEKYLLKQHLPHLGTLKNLKQIIKDYNIEEVIIAIETTEHETLGHIINEIDNLNVKIKLIPTMYDIITGTAKISSLFGEPLIQIKQELMPTWQVNLKRIIDVVGSVTAIILLSPLYIFLIIGVKLSSKGPIFYSHERIGRYGKPFLIYKFRSMIPNAEQNGPALSSDDDPRITKFGKFMRKSRLDELPQFYNVIKGDMSLVGPRPERQFFIDQIVKKAPHYVHLQKVRPGITSWGQVKFGYASNVDEMIERLKYDIIYIENMSLYVDFKIIIYTIKIILKLEGK